MKLFSVVVVSLFLTGCPLEENPVNCNKVMVCEDQREMVCAKNDSGCGQDCHYYVVEHCYERCK